MIGPAYKFRPFAQLLNWFRKPEPVRTWPVSSLQMTIETFYDPVVMAMLDTPYFMTAEEIQAAEDLKSLMALGRS